LVDFQDIKKGGRRKMHEIKRNYLIFRQWMIRKYPKIVCNLLKVTFCIGAFCFTFGFMIALALECTTKQIITVFVGGGLLAYFSGPVLYNLLDLGAQLAPNMLKYKYINNKTNK